MVNNPESPRSEYPELNPEEKTPPKELPETDFEPLTSPDWMPPAWLEEDPMGLPEDVEGFFDSVTMQEVFSSFPVRIEHLVQDVQEYVMKYPPMMIEIDGRRIVIGIGSGFPEFAAEKHQIGLSEITVKADVKEVKGKRMAIAVNEAQQYVFEGLFKFEIPDQKNVEKKLAVVHIVDNDGKIIKVLKVPIVLLNTPVASNSSVMATTALVHQLERGRFHLEIAGIETDYKRINLDELLDEEEDNNDDLDMYSGAGGSDELL